MSLFPDLAAYAQDPYGWKARFKTLVAGPFQNENVVTRATHQFPLHAGAITYLVQGAAGWTNVIQPVLEFHRDRRGRYESFTFYDLTGWDASPPGCRWNGCFVLVADGSTNPTYTLPARHSTANPISEDATLAVYSNGSAQTKTASDRSGLDGRTRVTISGTPAAGAIITADFTARRVWNAKFTDDEIDFQTRGNAVYTVSVSLIEVP